MVQLGWQNCTNPVVKWDTLVGHYSTAYCSKLYTCTPGRVWHRNFWGTFEFLFPKMNYNVERKYEKRNKLIYDTHVYKYIHIETDTLIHGHVYRRIYTYIHIHITYIQYIHVIRVFLTRWAVSEGLENRQIHWKLENGTIFVKYLKRSLRIALKKSFRDDYN